LIEEEGIPMTEARSRQAHQKAVLDRMLKALSGEEDVLITEAGALDQPPAPDPAMPLLQQVYYDLDLFGDVVDDDLQVTIVRTVARLPEEVRDMVIEECRFIEVPEVQTIRPATRPRWLILLRPDLPAADVPSLIARNIALVWLRRRQPARPCTLGVDLRAAKLVQSWGFEGPGADVAAAQQLVREYGAATLYLNAM
jgi:hypothetical protein